jgi:hypothetical protein
MPGEWLMKRLPIHGCSLNLFVDTSVLDSMKVTKEELYFMLVNKFLWLGSYKLESMDLDFWDNDEGFVMTHFEVEDSFLDQMNLEELNQKLDHLRRQQYILDSSVNTLNSVVSMMEADKKRIRDAVAKHDEKCELRREASSKCKGWVENILDSDKDPNKIWTSGDIADKIYELGYVDEKVYPRFMLQTTINSTLKSMSWLGYEKGVSPTTNKPCNLFKRKQDPVKVIEKVIKEVPKSNAVPAKQKTIEPIPIPKGMHGGIGIQHIPVVKEKKPYKDILLEVLTSNIDKWWTISEVTEDAIIRGYFDTGSVKRGSIQRGFQKAAAKYQEELDFSQRKEPKPSGKPGFIYYFKINGSDNGEVSDGRET